LPFLYLLGTGACTEGSVCCVTETCENAEALTPCVADDDAIRGTHTAR
jgi:hypothetical protein